MVNTYVKVIALIIIVDEIAKPLATRMCRQVTSYTPICLQHVQCLRLPIYSELLEWYNKQMIEMSTTSRRDQSNFIVVFEKMNFRLFNFWASSFVENESKTVRGSNIYKERLYFYVLFTFRVNSFFTWPILLECSEWQAITFVLYSIWNCLGCTTASHTRLLSHNYSNEYAMTKRLPTKHSLQAQRSRQRRDISPWKY